MRALPIACDTSAFGSSVSFAAHLEEGRRILSLATERQELMDGWGLRLPDDDATVLACTHWILDERRCCPFLTFTVEFQPDGVLWMRLRGPEGTKDILSKALSGEPRS